jgi:MFS family permease
MSRLIDLFRNQPSVPHDQLSDEDRKRSMRVALSTVVFSSIYMKGTMGPAIVGLFRSLGATPFWIGMLSATSGLSLIGQPIGSYLLSRSKSRKKLFLRLTLTGRVMLWGLVAGAMFLPPGIATVLVLFVSVLGCRFTGAMGWPSWYSWMSDLAPEDQRGWFWGTRNMVSNTVGMVAALALNWYLGDDPSMEKFVAFFIVIAICGMLDIYMHRGIHGVNVAAENSREDVGEMFRRPFRDRAFLPIVVFSFIFGFSCSLGSGMMHLMLLEEINLSYFEIAIYLSGVLGVVNVVASKYWGRLVDNLHEGARIVMAVCSVIVAVLPFLWVVTGPRDHLLVIANVIGGGLGWSGYMIAKMALIAAYSPQEHRPSYAATNAVVGGIGTMLGALVAGILAQTFQDVSMVIGPLYITSLRIPYIFSGFARMLSLLILPFIRMPDSVPLGVYVHQVLTMNPFRRGTWVYVRERVRSQNGGK